MELNKDKPKTNQVNKTDEENKNDLVCENTNQSTKHPKKPFTKSISLIVNPSLHKWNGNLEKGENDFDNTSDEEEKGEEEEDTEGTRTQIINCPICQDKVEAVVILKECKHHYCR